MNSSSSQSSMRNSAVVSSAPSSSWSRSYQTGTSMFLWTPADVIVKKSVSATASSKPTASISKTFSL